MSLIGSLIIREKSVGFLESGYIAMKKQRHIALVDISVRNFNNIWFTTDRMSDQKWLLLDRGLSYFLYSGVKAKLVWIRYLFQQIGQKAESFIGYNT
jgi:hypothetical protein